eukprot:15366600-Ditylum_brightwellii.AAC.1
MHPSSNTYNKLKIHASWVYRSELLWIGGSGTRAGFTFGVGAVHSSGSTMNGTFASHGQSCPQKVGVLLGSNGNHHIFGGGFEFFDAYSNFAEGIYGNFGVGVVKSSFAIRDDTGFDIACFDCIFVLELLIM